MRINEINMNITISENFITKTSSRKRKIEISQGKALISKISSKFYYNVSKVDNKIVKNVL